MLLKHPVSAGFTLIETIIVVAVLLVLAGMAVPTWSGLMDDAEVTSVRQELQRTRMAIDYYAFQHGENLPGQHPNSNRWTEKALLGQLLYATNADGKWAPAGSTGFAFGPYLLDTFPHNPFNDQSSVIVIAPNGSFAGPNNRSGWVYFAALGTFKANSTALTPDGTPVYDL